MAYTNDPDAQGARGTVHGIVDPPGFGHGPFGHDDPEFGTGFGDPVTPHYADETSPGGTTYTQDAETNG